MALQPLPTDFELTVPGNQKIEGDALIERHLHVVQTANVAGRLTVADTIDATGGGLLTNNLQLSLIDVDASQWPRLSANSQRQVELQGSLQVIDETIREREFGVVAQELEQVFPELVYSIEEHKLVKYHGLIPVLIEAFKTQQDLLTNLSAEVRSLQQQLLQGEHHAAKY